jgi:protein-tyrosine phosphatase
VATPLHICFVCSGNVCRSPYAEARMRQLIDDAGLSPAVVVTSAGTFNLEGDTAHPRTVEIAERRGASLRDFRSRGVNDDVVAAADLLVCMASEHLQELGDKYPAARFRMRLLRPAGPLGEAQDVPDPIGRRADEFEAALTIIDEALVGLLTDLRARISAWLATPP